MLDGPGEADEAEPEARLAVGALRGDFRRKRGLAFGERAGIEKASARGRFAGLRRSAGFTRFLIAALL